jgi:hypothetical protein
MSKRINDKKGLIIESLKNTNMSSFLLKEETSNSDNAYSQVIKSLNSLSTIFSSSQMPETASLLKKANSILAKQVGLLKSKKQDAKKDFNLLYTALTTFLVSLDNMFDGMLDSIETGEIEDSSSLDDAFDGGVKSHSDAFIPSKSSELFPKLKALYSDLEKLGTNEDAFLAGDIIEEGPGNAIIGIFKKLLGARTLPKTSKATAMNLKPLFGGGDILKALQDDMSIMTVGKFKDLRMKLNPELKKITGPFSSRSNPVTSQDANAQTNRDTASQIVPTKQSIAALTEPETMDSILAILEKDPKMKAIVKAIKKLSDDPRLVTKLDASNPDAQVLTSLANTAQQATQKGKELNPQDINAAVRSATANQETQEDQGEGPVENEREKISLKNLFSKLSDDEKKKAPSKEDLKSVAEQSDDLITLNPDFEELLGPALSEKLLASLKDFVKDNVVESKEIKNTDDKMIIERWNRIAGIIK